MATYKLIAATNNNGTDHLLLINDKVVSRWAELTTSEVTNLEDWDNQAAAGHDLSDYQADLDSDAYDQIEEIAEQSYPDFVPDGEWTNGYPIEFDSPCRRTEAAAIEDIFDRLAQLTTSEVERIKWVGVRKFEDGIASAAKIVNHLAK